MKNTVIRDKLFTRRAFIILGLQLSGFVLLFARLFYLQIIRGEHYKLLSDRNRIRTIILPASRGAILDINNQILASNKRCQDIYLNPHNIKNYNKIIKQIAELSGRKISASQLKKIRKMKFAPIKSDVDWEIVKKIELNKILYKRFSILQTYRRKYAFGEICSHILGYVNLNKNVNKVNNNVHTEGKYGLELTYEGTLYGQDGILKKEVNAKDEFVRTLYKKESISGSDIKLTLDITLQCKIYEILKLHPRSSVVVLDITTGDVMASVNYPSYDNNKFITNLTHADWAEIANDANAPMLNRSMALKISPGSVFKMITALCALEEGIITQDSTFECDGELIIGKSHFHCWKRSGHGSMAITEAIARSCNVYFYNLGLKIKMDRLMHYAQMFGLDEIFDIGMQDMTQGVIPNPSLINRLRFRWYLGDTLNAVIGHGYIAITPMHLAVMVARLASGTKVIPKLKFSYRKSEFESLDVSLDNMNLVRNGMFDVINSDYGTARSIRSDKYDFAGKTGTVQVVGSAKKNKSNLATYDHSVFVGYAPFDQPKYAIASVIEHGGSGRNAANIARKSMDLLLS